MAQRVQELRQVFTLFADEPPPLNQISALQEDETRFYVVTILEQSEDRLQLVYAEWPKQRGTTWWQANQSQFDVAEFQQPGDSYALPAVNAAAARNPESDTRQYMPAMPWHTTTSRSVFDGQRHALGWWIHLPTATVTIPS
ncbi:MAG: hypothetical protein IPL78_34735 [Chloroflexi bacterium]|nr:hypothetical protein [Chloroflexota bacterium]